MTEPSQDKLMPRDPTPEMLMAGRKQTFADMTGEHCGPNTERTWQAMFDAAPDTRPDVSTDVLVEEVARAIGAQAEMYDVLLEDEEYAFARAAIATMQPTIEAMDIQRNDMARLIEALQRSNAEKDEALRAAVDLVQMYGSTEAHEQVRKALSHSSDGGNNAV